MVSRYSTEPGPRLGAIDTRTASGLRIRCGRCMDERIMPLGEALRLWGARSTLQVVARDLKCSRCTGKEAEVSIELRGLRVVGE